MLKSLTSRQRKFCREYILLNSGAKAARAAGYTVKSAKTKACDLLKDPIIKNYVNELKKKELKDYNIRKDTVIQEIKDVIRLSKASGKYNSCLRGYEILNNMLGFNSKTEVSVTFTFSEMVKRVNDGK